MSPDAVAVQQGILSRLTLRMRLAVAFTTGLLALVTLVSMAYLAAGFNARQTLKLQTASTKLDFVNGLAVAATELQLAATRYVYLGHTSAQESVSSSTQRWGNELADCRVRDCLPSARLDDIEERLQAFIDAFTQVTASRTRIMTALSREFAAIRASTPLHNKNTAPANADIGREALQINSINDHITTIEATLFTYFVTADPQKIADAQAHLEELKSHIADARYALLTGQTSAATNFSVESLESSLYANIQRIRSYAYLVNVVMPSEARELEYLAGSAAVEVKAEIARLRSNVAKSRASFYRWELVTTVVVLLLSVPVFFWVLNSVTSPLRHLAAVFHRLSEGSEEHVMGANVTNDEIGDLFKAAEAFRRENIRERELLADYRELSRTLEAQVALRTQELTAKNQALDHLASVDKLTDTLNRRALDEALIAELERAKRYQRPMSLLLMDIDLFKQVNDHYGHLTGDKVLVTLTQSIKSSLRASDILGRWGGEEFLVICPESSLQQAQNIAEKVRSRIEQTDFAIGRKITISVGIAMLREGSTSESLVAEADRALYRAKTQGRNLVCTAPTEVAPQPDGATS